MADLGRVKRAFDLVVEEAPTDRRTKFNLSAAELLLDLADEIATDTPTGAAAVNSLLGKAVRLVNDLDFVGDGDAADVEFARMMTELQTPILERPAGDVDEKFGGEGWPKT